MEFSPRAAELTTLLESRIGNFYTNFQVDEIGRVVSVGDGIARVYGLNEIQAGEMVEFASGVKGIALNLENENVGIVVVVFLFLFIILLMAGQGQEKKRKNPSSSSGACSSSRGTDGTPRGERQEKGRKRIGIKTEISSWDTEQSHP